MPTQLPWGMDELLARKYAILGQQADSGTVQANAASVSANAQAALDRAKIALLPAESASTIGLQKAQGGLLGAQAGLAGEQTKYFGQTALAGIANTNSGTRVNNANALTAEQLLEKFDLGMDKAKPRAGLLGIGQSFGGGLGL